jgi:hypothetical protein
VTPTDARDDRVKADLPGERASMFAIHAQREPVRDAGIEVAACAHDRGSRRGEA